MRARRAAVLLLLLAAPRPTRADPAAAPTAEEARALEARLARYFPKHESPDTELLNLSQRYGNDSAALSRAYADYVRANAHAPGRPDDAPPSAADLQVICDLSDRLNTYFFSVNHGGRTPPAIKVDAPAPAADAAPAEPAAPGSGVAAPAAPAAPQAETTRERLLDDVAGPSGDPTLIAAAARLADDRGDYAKAAAQLTPLARGDDASTDVLLDYARAALGLGRRDVARAAAARALKKDPGNEAAVGLLHAATALPPAPRPRSLAQAAAGFDAARDDSGLSAGGAGAAPSSALAPSLSGFGAGRARSPQSEAALRAAVDALKMEDGNAAIAAANKALALNPDDGRAFALIAVAESRRPGFAEETLRDADRALALLPGNPLALGARLRALAQLGRYREALACADALVAAEPKSAEARVARGYALAGLGDKKGALAELRRAAELDPRWKDRLSQAVALPSDADMTLLFADAGDFAAPAPAPAAGSFGDGLAAYAATAAGAAALLVLLGLVVAAVRRLTRPAAAARLPAAAPPPALAARGYRIVRPIGSGGMGTVYEARDSALGRRVALKRIREDIRRDPTERTRLLQEARTVAKLKHPNIVDIYAIESEGDELSLVFEYVDGRTLHDLLYREPLGFERALALLRPICAAVEHAHAAGVIHRDLKPANVMVDSAGAVKVMDFGIARLAREAPRRTSAAIGTPPYMAPEQEQGVIRRESDVYSLAVCLYEMTLRAYPFEGQGGVLSLNKLEGRPRRAEGVAGVPPGFDAAMTRALAADPAARPRTPSELLAILDGLLAPRA